jgi:hypothetical protein
MITAQTGLSVKGDCISKITRAKRSGGMVHMVEHLPTKCKAKLVISIRTALPFQTMHGVVCLIIF